MRPEAVLIKNRKARKEHKCCECHSIIKVTEVYRQTSGIWEGEAYSFRQCIACAEISDMVWKLDILEDEGPSFGDLKSWVRDYVADCNGDAEKELIAYGEQK